MEQIKRIDNTTIEIDGVLYKAEETTKQGNLDEVESLVLEYVKKNKLNHYICAAGEIARNFNQLTYNHSTENHTKARRLKMLWEMLAKVLNEGELDWSISGIRKSSVYMYLGKIEKETALLSKQEGTTYFKNKETLDKAISLFGEENLLFMIKNS
jgi:hypothetical protein